MSAIGIIANPAAGKDIRRIVSHGFVVDNQEKVNIVRRAVLGAAAMGCKRILLMPDAYGIGRRALDRLGAAAMGETECALLDLPVTDTAADTVVAAGLMQEAGAGCVIVLGGDGTVRVAAKGAAGLPLLPISTGTNNVLPTFVEGTLAGMAAALIASQPNLRSAVRPRHGLVVHLDGHEVDLALVDVACLRGSAIGARAMWDWRPVRDVVAAHPRAAAIGLSAIVGVVFPDGAEAAWVRLGEAAEAKEVLAAIAPGNVAAVSYLHSQRLRSGDTVPLGRGPLVVALDGEREWVVREQELVVEVRRACASIVDVGPCLAEAARWGLLSPRAQ